MIAHIPATVHVTEDIYARMDTGWATFEIDCHIHGYVDGYIIDAVNNALVKRFEPLGSLTGNTFTKGQSRYRP